MDNADLSFKGRMPHSRGHVPRTNEASHKQGEKHMLKNVCPSFLLSIALCFLVLTLTGCSKPPAQEIEDAKKAIAEAKKQEADLYVQPVFTESENALQRALDLVAEKKHNEAKGAAVEAAVLARQAASQVEQNKMKMREANDQAAIEAQKLMEEIKVLAAEAIRKKLAKSEGEIQTSIGKAELDMVTVKGHMQSDSVRQAHDEIASLLEHLNARKQTLASVLEQKQPAKNKSAGRGR
jgi:hypothetical protein